MQYFGVPTCPYCKKRVNIIRVWSMKKHGEFMCPRCKGISNIKLSPLVYVCAVLAVAAGFLIYFFAKFVLENVSIMTPVYVLIPFIIFFFVSLFFVYLEKPVIRKVRKSADGKYYDENGNEMKMRMGKLVPDDGMNQRNQPYNNRYQDIDGVKTRQRPVSSDVKNRTFVDNEELYNTLNKKTDAGYNSRKIAGPDSYAEKTAPRPAERAAARENVNKNIEMPAGDAARRRTEEERSSPLKQPGETRAPRQRQQATQPRRTEQEQKKKSGGSRFRDL